MASKFQVLLVFAGVASFLTGCVGFLSAPVVPPTAFVYTEYSAPMDIDADETRMGDKMGTAEIATILGIVSTGDASIAAAAKAGGIKVIRHVDYKLFSVLGLYTRFTTIVYGDAEVSQ